MVERFFNRIKHFRIATQYDKLPYTCLTSPHLTSPHLTSPHLTSPRVHRVCLRAARKCEQSLVLLCHKMCRGRTAEWASLEPLSDVRSDAPAQRGDRVSHVALRALGSRVAR
ncbi:hypothetical protein IAG25_41110, partial [Caballeronia sp. EK]|nr:hypothetical protein [Caballeronia sp. EK]